MPLTVRTTLFAALLTGLLGGLSLFVIQFATTQPLIVRAEVMEQAELRAKPSAHDHAAEAHEHEWEPEDGAERTIFTLAADVLIAVGFGLLLVGAIGLSGRDVDLGSGLLWGWAGFLVFALAPALRVPPEPPGGQPADLVLRQVWWFGTALLSAAGLWASVLQRRVPVRLGGLALLLLPFVLAAPHAVEAGSGEQRSLANQFLWASLASNATMWIVLGLAAGYLLPKMTQQRPASAAGVRA